ncbi:MULTISPECIES: hypothetical protein [unclassified Oceanispirochaeta]|uniref:hypothetical protein n=1 Tax=unclassified Oceanispirochaeta TaxID=2635722 RepID=UPI000E092A01|nr:MULTISPECIES: hypothetical protein [unclassified Oceanispirochaeta]MBF9014704.1 hypothetical protein [Oceanispirochaeta sp. M2]NPD70960.1 hypothetical protein [Oceanispirochaeta sp. M1]RDG33793.1 hypothetical protein DV872_02510 [Oceanispirochaeta sp. M1]
MKKIIYILLTISVLTFSMSCDKLLVEDPEVRGYLDPYWSSVYGALGTVDAGGFTTVTDWMFIPSGGFSSYTSSDPGTYYVIYDSDTDHSSARYYTTPVTVESNKSYTFYIDSSGYMSFSED